MGEHSGEWPHQVKRAAGSHSSSLALDLSPSDLVLDTAALFQEAVGVWKRTGRDVHLGVIAKGNGFRIKGMNILDDS